jgi:surfeit locus 1 family protein
VFLSPRWLLSHLFALSVVVAFIVAGFWQVDSLRERQDQNVLIETRMQAPVVLSDVIEGDQDTIEFRRVQMSGRFDPGSEILIANRSDEGAPGFWIWTNFVTDDGDILVNRGFVNRGVILETAGSAPRSDADATEGPVIIEGLLREGLDGGRASQDETQLTRPDAELAVELLDLDPVLAPAFYVELDTQQPVRVSPTPAPVPEPDLGEGPHRSYAFQWFTFATIGTIGYVLVLLRIKRGDQTKGDVTI